MLVFKNKDGEILCKSKRVYVPASKGKKAYWRNDPRSKHERESKGESKGESTYQDRFDAKMDKMDTLERKIKELSKRYKESDTGTHAMSARAEVKKMKRQLAGLEGAATPGYKKDPNAPKKVKDLTRKENPFELYDDEELGGRDEVIKITSKIKNAIDSGKWKNVENLISKYEARGTEDSASIDKIVAAFKKENPGVDTPYETIRHSKEKKGEYLHEKFNEVFQYPLLQDIEDVEQFSDVVNAVKKKKIVKVKIDESWTDDGDPAFGVTATFDDGKKAQLRLMWLKDESVVENAEMGHAPSLKKLQSLLKDQIRGA